ncbi:hypothetical protein [Endozoicomonas elysicola]|uniref:hypothetical protein n=1 Tax=Endozoicomonas elysicola TaxID=305900 RepID=UPI00200B0821|nr:hypothetical protein [Endozoicomonas elysicola]
MKYGLNRQIMFLVGLLELFGAIICHLLFDTWKDGIPAMVTLLLSDYVVSIDWELLMSSIRNIF